MSTDMTTSLTTLAVEINAHHEQAQEHARSAIEHAFECGTLLNQAKSETNHGEWMSWLEANTIVSNRTAQRYMKLADNQDVLKNDTVSDLTVRGALKQLTAARPETPPFLKLDDLSPGKRHEIVSWDAGASEWTQEYQYELRMQFCFMLSMDGMDIEEISEYLNLSLSEVTSALEFEPLFGWVMSRMELNNYYVAKEHRDWFAHDLNTIDECDPEHVSAEMKTQERLDTGDYEEDLMGWLRFTQEAGLRAVQDDIAHFKRWNNITASWVVSGWLEKSRPVLAEKISAMGDQLMQGTGQ